MRQKSYAGLTRVSIFFGKNCSSKKMDHRVKPGDDKSSAPLHSFHGTAQNSPESGWIATISKTRFRTQHEALNMGNQIWSQP